MSRRGRKRQLREFVSLFIERVAVGKVAYRGMNRFDPGRVAPPDEWWKRA